jgi:hypothetical protein
MWRISRGTLEESPRGEGGGREEGGVDAGATNSARIDWVRPLNYVDVSYIDERNSRLFWSIQALLTCSLKE